MLALTADSQLADWSMRNDVEHIDERIDRWVGQQHSIFSYSLGGISRTGQPPEEPVIRHYDSESDILYIGNASITLKLAVEAVRDVAGCVAAFRQRWEVGPV